MQKNKRVVILMATYNGARFLEKQLASIEKSIHQNFELWVSDDGSKDQTLDILDSYQERWQKLWGEKRLFIQKGPRKGFGANFLSLLKAPFKADYVAFSDQDDIWLPHKLSQALERLEIVPDGAPALYCGRTELINEEENPLGLSPLFQKPPC